MWSAKGETFSLYIVPWVEMRLRSGRQILVRRPVPTPPGHISTHPQMVKVEGISAQYISRCTMMGIRACAPIGLRCAQETAAWM